MSTHGDRLRSTVVPTVRYRDVPAAIVWLEDAFGFQQHRILTDDAGEVRYAELTFGAGMVMVGPVEEDNLGKFMVQPGEIGGVATQICYLHVENAKAHCERAAAAGATIVLDITDEDDGGRGYSARDLEGHIWNFGTYNPWLRFNPKEEQTPANKPRSKRRLMTLAVLAIIGGALAFEPARSVLNDAAENVVVRIAAASDSPTDNDLATSDNLIVRTLRAEVVREQAARQKSEQAVAQLREQLVLEATLREAAEQSSTQSRTQLTALLTKYENTGRSAAEVRAELERAQAAKTAAELTAKEAREKMARVQAAENERQARQLARRERIARNRAERAAAYQKEAAASAYPAWICGRISC
jgi:uncharacterized glyoxalase superfamily protein PhnB